MTLTEWFNEKVSEVTLQPNLFEEIELEIKNLDEITDSSEVLQKLQKVNWDFTKSNTTYFSHNIHPYPAKFIPQIPHYLIQMLSTKGEIIWDPFGGSGTTALEALLLGRQTISSDINPIASLVGKAKTLTLNKEEDDTIIDFIEKVKILSESKTRTLEILDKHKSDIHKSTPNIPNIDKWFHSNAIDELAYLRWQIEKIELSKCKILLYTAFSKIIIKSSFQDGETRYSSKYRDVQHGEILKMYVAELASALNKIRLLSSRLRFREANFIDADLRNNKVVDPNSVDLIVTSPPYANATDYFLYHRFRLFWLGYDPRTFAKSEIGAHLRHQKEHTGFEDYINEMSECLTRMFNGLRTGRYAVLVVGNAIFNGNQFETAKLLSERAHNLGFEVVGIINRNVHSTKRSFISAARRLEEESLLILRKPLICMKFKLIAPNYKLWEYENEIRNKEVQRLYNSIPLEKNGSQLIINIDPLKVDLLRRLTFTHFFEADEYHRASTWQATLENGDASVLANRKDPKYVTHGLHPYKGKFYPQLAKSLFNLAELYPGQTVLDPFCGSGTVLLEGYLNGLSSIGFDINPLAVKIAKAKTEILSVDPYLTDKLLTYVVHKLDNLLPLSDYPLLFDQDILEELESWFPRLALQKIGAILKLLDEIPEPKIKEFIEICLSSIVRDISQQDPKDLRIRRRKQPIDDAPVFEFLKKRIIDQRQRLIKFAQVVNKAPFQFGDARILYGDCRDRISLRKLR